MKKNLLISLLMCIIPISLSSCNNCSYIMHEGEYELSNDSDRQF